MRQLSASQLKDWLADTERTRPVLLDVREPNEHALAHIPQARLLPLATLPEHLDTLPRDREILIHCKAGGRSAKAVQLLLDNGFTRVKNVSGGMDAWLEQGW